MKKLFYTTALACVLSLSANGALANQPKSEKEADSHLIKASYALPKKDGNDFRQTLHEADEENLQIKQKISFTHADLYDLMTAPDFDHKAFRAKLQDLRQLEAQAKENHDDAVSAAIAELTPDERTTLANALEINPKYAEHRHRKAAGNGTSDSGGRMQDASPSAGNSGDNSQQ